MYVLLNFIPQKYNIENTIEGFIKYLDDRHIIQRILHLKYQDKCKTKRVILYGAGLFAEAFFQFYKNDFNIIAIADNKFEQGKQSEYKGYIAINPRDIENFNPDIILISVYQEKQIINFLKQIGIKTKAIPIIKKSFFEKLFETRI